MPIIVVSNEDLAGQTILTQLLKHFDFKENGTFEGNPKYNINNIDLIITNKKLIYSDHLDDLETDLFIFGSRHKSESERPSLLAHSTGNWGEEALFGGNPKELAIAPAFAIKEAILELNNQKNKLNLPFDVTIEVSHHGPTNLSKPLVFIELGSNEKHWKNQLGAEAVAKTIMKVAFTKNRYKTVIGFGGTHYCPNFNRLIFNSDIATSHIAPKYVLDNIDPDVMIEKAIKRTFEKVEMAVLDWKGMNSKQKKKVVNKLESMNLPFCKLTELL